ncbi:MAG: Dam family site-specific DNA-(adenine-N6)-methyltransferase [Herpetosiphonaceae bacterium]|nr:Dam family site-specific DNA-(adenine-N6)-methyltransferase [Herpetosiphonaceae bacterium]
MPLKPPLKWAGGKRWLVPHLHPIWTAHQERRLVEPFSGGLAVTLAMRPAHALLNDINPHAINFYRWLKKGFTVDIPTQNDRELYYDHRKRFNQLITNSGAESKEAAQLFYFLNRTGYNGLCRFNKKGEFNVPFGKYKQITYTSEFSKYTEAFTNWVFTVGDFERMQLHPEDFVYADPPYDVEFTQYSKEGFTWNDQVRLAKWLAQHPGPVVLSNQATPRVVHLYKELGFSLRFLDAPRMINCTGDRSSAKEVLGTKGV